MVEERESGAKWESIIETYALPYVKYIASLNLLYDAGSSNPVLCDNLDKWGWVEGKREVEKGGYLYIPMADSYWCMAEANTTL